MGILIMNIQSFSMSSSAYINPTAFGDLTGINKWVWIFSHVIASSKFMSIFSILFGAGMLLFTERAIAKGRKASAFHYRRMFWLLIFGLMHAYLIWYGDILVAYALCGMLVFVFRKKKVSSLITLSIVFFVIPIFLNLLSGSTIEQWPPESYEENLKTWIPGIQLLNEEIVAMQGGWLTQMNYRIPQAYFMETFLFFWLTFWRATSMMLLGMALFKSGVLSAQKSTNYYIKMSLIGLIFGYALISIGVFKNFEAGWTMEFSMFFGNQFNYIGSLGVALGYIALVMLIAKSVKFVKFKALLYNVGKMAFTNYILMSVLAMFIFYGNGFGLFGQVERQIQILIVFAIWIVILFISHFWLKKFRFGPLEWLWRVLTYWKRQPMIKNKFKIK